MNKIHYKDRKDIYRDVIETFGEEHQRAKFDEELGEFLTEYGRIQNGEGDLEAFAEELADLTIMLEQLRQIYGVDALVCAMMDFKVTRLFVTERKVRELRGSAGRETAGAPGE